MICAALLALVLAGHGQTASAQTIAGPHVEKSGALVRAGKPWRGIGANYFDAFARTLATVGDRSYEAGFHTLGKNGIPFARIEACGFWPADNRLYFDNREEYYGRLDAVVESAGRNQVGLILSLFWNPSTVPDLTGEPVNSWGDRRSKTRAFMRQYVREVVSRYRTAPAIWGYEFGNEYNLAASLPNARDHRPPTAPSLGTPQFRTDKDELSYETIRSAFAEFASEVRRVDSRRLVITGDAFPRESAWHNWKEGSWTQDTPEQFAAMLRDNNPSPVNTISVHAYGNCAGRIRQANAAAKRLRKPLFIGEFGARNEQGFRENLSTIETARVPMAALWVFDYAEQDGDWNVTESNNRSYQLRAIADANRRIQREGKR